MVAVRSHQFPLPTIPTRHTKRAKSPYFCAFCAPNAAIPTSFPTFFHSPKTFKKACVCACFHQKTYRYFHFFHFFHSTQKEWKNVPYFSVFCAPAVSDC